MKMAFELERVLYQTEDFLRRAIGSPNVREAKKRRLRRKMEEFGRRARRSAFVLVGLVALLLGVSIYRGIGFFAWLIALPTAFFFCLVLLFQPTRHARRRAGAVPDGEAPQALPLGALALRAEEWLLDRCDEIPGHALPAADAILARLKELQPHWGALDPSSVLAGDARRLIGQHLPRLVDSYLALPASARAPRSESSIRFAESLFIVAAELDNLLAACCRDSQASFDTQSRFIETRYKGDDRLRGE